MGGFGSDGEWVRPDPALTKEGFGVDYRKSELCAGCLSNDCSYCPKDDGYRCHGCPCDDCVEEDGKMSNYYSSYTIRF